MVTKVSKFDYLNGLIRELSRNEKYLLPAFLLRAQQIEFVLKYLLVNAPYKPADGLGEKPVEELTMGQAIEKLAQLRDSHFDGIIKNAREFVQLRNELTHNFLTSGTGVEEINAHIKRKMKIAAELEHQILYFFDYLRKVFGLPHYP